MEKTFTVVPRGRRAGDRLQHLPDLELLARAVRLAGHRQPGRRQAAPGAPCCRWRSPCRSARRCSPRPASTRNLVTLAAEDPADKLAADAGRAARGEARSTSPAATRSATGWRSNARQAMVFTEKAGVNTVVVDSTDDFEAMCQQPRVLVRALHRPDVHRPAERLPARRRHRDRRGPQDRRPRSAAGHRRGVRQAARRRRPRGRAARRRRQRRRARAARGGRRRTGEVLRRVARPSPTRRTPTRRSARPR